MKVLLVGNGGREHALAWRLEQCASVNRIVCPNGNPGISLHAEIPRLSFATMAEWAEYALRERMDLVVIGPEAPLAAGLADECEARGIRTFGPCSAAARLESSKAFAKEIMLAANIPTARSGTFSDYDRARDFARSLGLPVVIKADGLAAGKGHPTFAITNLVPPVRLSSWRSSSTARRRRSSPSLMVRKSGR
jgi:phosphoribosylamine--glycine ligase